MIDASWPPPFTVRISDRAKYARLRVLPLTGLEVVLPRGMEAETAIALVERHKEWVRKHIRRVCGDAGNIAAQLPQEICLHGGFLRLPVRYGQQEDTVWPENGRIPDTVLVHAPESDPQTAIAALREWVREYAARVLGEEAVALASLHDLPFTSLIFRCQKSRWGSCSAKKALSLNLCLAFLPRYLSRHVILHELTHTRHMNHGRGFWKTLFGLEPDALALDRRLRSAWQHVPPWIWL